MIKGSSSNMSVNKRYCFFSSMSKKEREVIMYRQARSLIADGFDVVCVVSDTKPVEIEQGVSFISSGYKASNFLQRLFFAPHKLYRKLLEVDADVYHTVHVDQLRTCLKLKRRGKKVLFEMQENHPFSLMWKSNLPKWMLRPIIWLMAKWMAFALKRVDAITTLSYDTEAYLKSWGIAPEKIHLWGNFPEINKDYELSLDDYLKRENRVLYFGLIYSYSKQEVFLKAISKLPNVYYLVAGKFMGNELDTYRPKIMNMPEWKNVEFVDGFKHPELAFFIKRSTISNVLRDFSVYSEGNSGSFGIIKIFESMEAALPIICSDMPIYRDIMKEYKCGILVDPLNEDEIRNAIEYLVTHKEEAWRMGQEGRRAVIEKYSWDALSKKYLGIINGLLYN